MTMMIASFKRASVIARLKSDLGTGREILMTTGVHAEWSGFCSNMTRIFGYLFHTRRCQVTSPFFCLNHLASVRQMIRVFIQRDQKNLSRNTLHYVFKTPITSMIQRKTQIVRWQSISPKRISKLSSLRFSSIFTKIIL